MKLKLRQVIQSLGYLNQLSGKSGLPMKISYNIGKTLKTASTVVQEADEQRVARVKELANKDESGKPIFEKEKNSFQLTPENLKVLEEELNNLQDQIVEIYCTPINLSELGNVDISPAIYANLEWLFVDDLNAPSVAANQ